MYIGAAESDPIQHGSKESPIRISEKDTGRHVGWEYKYIERTIGPYKFFGQALLLVGGKHLDLVKVTDRSGRYHHFYFDVSAKLEKEGEELERAWKEMQRHPEKLPPEMRALLGRLNRQGQ